MELLVSEKLTVVGVAGIIDSDMAQTAIVMRLTPNICSYDPLAPVLEGIAGELYHCGSEGVNPTFIFDIRGALTGASYIVSSDRATHKVGMAHEDLLKEGVETTAQSGEDAHRYYPSVEHIIVIFNPVDVTGLITLLYSDLKSSQVSTLVALNNARLQNELVKSFYIPASDIQNCHAHGGYDEQMTIFASTTKIKGRSLTDFIGTTCLPLADWGVLKVCVIQGGKHTINLCGRSSLQSPAYLSIEMITAIVGEQPFHWPVGTYVSNSKFDHIMMVVETSITRDSVTCKEVAGTPTEQEELEKNYEHLCELRDEVVEIEIIPAIRDWHVLNPNTD